MAKKKPDARPARTAPATRAQQTRTARAVTPPESLADSIAWICLHALVFLVPLAMSNFTPLGAQIPYTFDQFDIVKVVTMRAFILIAFGAWTYSVVIGRRFVRWHPIFYAILVFLAWVVVTTVTSIHPPTAIFGKYRRFEGLLSFITYAVTYFLVVQYADRAGRIRQILRTLFFSGLIVSFYGLLQYLQLDPFTWGTLPFEKGMSFSTYGNPDLLGGFIIFPLAIALGLALSEQDSLWRIVYWIGFLVTSMVWITAFVRGAWIGGGFALLLIVFAAWRARLKPTTVDWSFIGGSTVAVGAVIARSASSPSEVMNFFTRFSSIVQFDQGSAKTRFEIWGAAWRAFLASPIVGWGADTFRLLFPKYKPVQYVADAGYLSVADNVHNYWLQTLSALGAPGLALILFGVFGWSLWISLRQAFASGKGTDRLLYAAVFAGAAGYMLQLTFGIAVTGSAIFLWIFLGILVAPFAAPREVNAGQGLRITALSLTAAIVLVGSVANVRYLQADHYYLLSRAGGTATLSPVDAAKKAVAIDPWNDMYRAEIGMRYQEVMSQWLQQETQLQQQSQDTSQAAQQAGIAFTAAAAAFEDTVRFIPPEYDNYVFLTNIYGVYAQATKQPAYYEKSVQWYERGKAIEPYGPAVRYWGALSLAGLGRNDEALKELNYAAKMDPNYAEPRMVAAQLYAERGDKAKARELYTYVLTLRPGDAQVTAALQALDSSSTTGGAGK